MKLNKYLQRIIISGVALLAITVFSFILHSTALAASPITLKGGPFYWTDANNQPQLLAAADNTSVKVCTDDGTCCPGSSSCPALTPQYANGVITIQVPSPPATVGKNLTVSLTYSGPDKGSTDPKTLTKIFTVSAGSGAITIFGGNEITTKKELLNVKNLVKANDDPCASSDGILGKYVLCPLTVQMLNGLQIIYESMISPLLQVNPLTQQDPITHKTSAVFAVWDVIKNLANFVLVFIFFVIIFSQATSLGLSSYGIKKILPKLIIGAIAINISFFVCSFLIDIFNVLGVGGAGLINAALASANVDPKFSSGVLLDVSVIPGLVATIMTSIVALPVILIGIVLFAIIALLLFIVAVVMLLIRQIMIILLVLAAPLAFAAWLLPNTEKYFGKWWAMFFKLLALYPIIALLFGATKLMVVAIGSIQADEATKSILALFQLLAIAIPFAFIPLVYKNLGGVWGHSGAQAWFNGKRKGITGRIGGYAKKTGNEYLGQARGNAASHYDPTKGSYSGKNLLIRGFTGNLAPGSTSRRKIIGMGEKHRSEATQEAQYLLQRAGIFDPGKMAVLAAGGSVQNTRGQTIAGNDPNVRRAAIRGIIGAGEAGAMQKMFMNSQVDQNMLYEEIQSNYSTVKAAGAGLVKLSPDQLVNGAHTLEQIDKNELVESAKLNYNKFAAMDTESATAAARAFVNQRVNDGGDTAKYVKEALKGNYTQDASGNRQRLYQLSADEVASRQALFNSATQARMNEQVYANAKEGVRNSIDLILREGAAMGLKPTNTLPGSTPPKPPTPNGGRF